MTTVPRKTQRGAVTAELAVALPVLVSFTVGLVWLLSLAAAQARAVDAAREAARAAARGDGVEQATALGRTIAPPDSDVEITLEGSRVRAVVSGALPGPGGLFASLPAAKFHAEAVAALEDHGGR